MWQLARDTILYIFLLLCVVFNCFPIGGVVEKQWYEDFLSDLTEAENLWASEKTSVQWKTVHTPQLAHN